MANETVTARLARIVEVVDEAIDELKDEKDTDLAEMREALQDALDRLTAAYTAASTGLVQLADSIIDSRYFTDYDTNERYVYKLGCEDGHPTIKLTPETAAQSDD